MPPTVKTPMMARTASISIMLLPVWGDIPDGVSHRRGERARGCDPPILCSVSGRAEILRALGVMEGKLPERPGRIPRAPAVKNIATPCDPFPNLFFPKMLPNTDIVSSSLPSDSETSYTTPPPHCQVLSAEKKRFYCLFIKKRPLRGVLIHYLFL